MNIIGYRKFWLTISGIFVAASIALIVAFGLPFGLDFTGGSLLEVRYGAGAPVSTEQVQAALQSMGLAGEIQTTDAGGFVIREKELNEEQHQTLIKKLKDLAPNEAAKQPVSVQVEGGGQEQGGTVTIEDDKGKQQIVALGGQQQAFEEVRFESIGPAVGGELKRKAWFASIISIIFIVLYIAWAFRKVSKPVRSWQYGLIAIVALVHDVVIPLGVFALLGHLGTPFEVNVAFIAAVLTILGYSVSDTIVVFDRIRENLLRRRGDDFETLVNDSVNETIARSINTTVTVFLTLLALFFFGGDTIKGFVLVLLIGIAAGAYSSIFVASPLLVVLERRARKV
ncbi:MAG: protein translocase subunit SecF [bacterium]|nr:protein translocase subunit SecF [bacterium]